MTPGRLVGGRAGAVFGSAVMVLGWLAAPSPLKADFIYYSTIGELPVGAPNSQIKRANLDGSGVQTILSGPAGGRFGGIAFDVANGHLYSGDGKFLFRANLDGTGRTNLVSTLISGNIGGVADVEVDLLHGKVYWSEFLGGPPRVRRANLDGTGAETILTASTALWEGIALDPTNGKLYIANAENAGIGSSTIEVANLDGSGRSTLFTLGVAHYPFETETDLATGAIYWNEGASFQRVQKGNLDGSGGIQLVVAPASGLTNGIHFDADNRQVYFTSFSALDLGRVNPDGTGVQTVLTDPGRINYIEVLPTQAATVPEPSTIMVFGIGIAALLTYCCHRRRRAFSVETGLN